MTNTKGATVAAVTAMVKATVAAAPAMVKAMGVAAPAMVRALGVAASAMVAMRTPGVCGSYGVPNTPAAADCAAAHDEAAARL
jgi:hypothetical protein